MASKGALSPGADADLAILTRSPQIWDSSKANDELRYSPFDGREFLGRVTRAYLAGALAWDGQAVINSPGAGRYVSRGDSRWF